MEGNINQAIDQLADKIGVAADKIIPYYVQWYSAKGWAWVIFGFALFLTAVIGSAIIYLKKKDSYNDEYADVWAVSILIFGIFMGGLFIAWNIPDIIGAHGRAIHDLVKALRRG